MVKVWELSCPSSRPTLLQPSLLVHQRHLHTLPSSSTVLQSLSELQWCCGHCWILTVGAEQGASVHLLRGKCLQGNAAVLQFSGSQTSSQLHCSVSYRALEWIAQYCVAMWREYWAERCVSVGLEFKGSRGRRPRLPSKHRSSLCWARDLGPQVASMCCPFRLSGEVLKVHPTGTRPEPAYLIK
jgi:hypothetical protein